MTAWFVRTATLLLLAFPIFLSALLLLATFLLMAAFLLLSAFQLFFFLSVHSNPPLGFRLKNKLLVGL
jgi:hypothetical protein